MKPFTLLLVTVATVAGVVAYMARASGEAEKEAAPIFVTEIPEGYRSWRLIAVSRLSAAKGSQLRAELGNDIAIKAYQEGKLPFPDGAIIAALHWNEVSSEENNKVLAKGFPGAGIQSFVPGSGVNIQFMVKDSKKYAAGVTGWTTGQRVGVGWHGGYCGRCNSCRRGDLFACETQQVTGISFDGGYGEYMIAPVSAVARFPDDLPPIDAAPLLCAGITTFNALRNSGARPGDVVAVLGLGGLGHLGVQYAAKSGFRTVAIARGKHKEPLARQLGASIYIDSQSQDPAAELQKLGGANVILSIVTVGDAMSAVQGGLAVKGTLIVIGAAESVKLSPIALLMGNRSVKGWYSGTSIDSQDTLAFSARIGVRSMNEIFPLEKVNEAYDRMMSGKARFRVVLTMK